MEINWRDDLDEKDQKKQMKLQFGTKKEDQVIFKPKVKSQKERDNNKALRGTGMKRELDL